MIDTKELERLKEENADMFDFIESKYSVDFYREITDMKNQYELADEENQQLMQKIEKLEKELKRKSLLLEHAVELIEDREKEIEELSTKFEKATKERDEARKHLWEAVKALEYIIVKTGNEPFNVQFIVKPLRDIAREALFHIQENRHGSNDDIPETVEILCVDCKETKTVPYSINPQYRCDDCAGKRVRVKSKEERLDFQEDDCPSCEGTGFTGFARTFDETCSCCVGTGKLPKAPVSTE